VWPTQVQLEKFADVKTLTAILWTMREVSLYCILLKLEEVINCHNIFISSANSTMIGHKMEPCGALCNLSHPTTLVVQNYLLFKKTLDPFKNYTTTMKLRDSEQTIGWN